MDQLKNLKESGSAAFDQAWEEIGLHDLDEAVVSRTPAASLARYLSKYPAGSAQHILATYEFQRRLTTAQTRATYIACIVSGVWGIVGVILGVWLSRH